jgi:hypothetical protein
MLSRTGGYVWAGIQESRYRSIIFYFNGDSHLCISFNGRLSFLSSIYAYF